jgi:molybdenum cofactor biosynthesis enzyme MoaA
MIDKLENIGFYTLCDDRAKNASSVSPMWRVEMIITDRCNFNCPYCRGMKEESRGDILTKDVFSTIDLLAKNKLKHIRFSGGEPTAHPDLLSIIKYSKDIGIERIAISTNGSADTEYYEKLIKEGVNDFSISLDACCASFTDEMTGVKGQFDKIVKNIKYISAKTYVTVGVVFTDQTLKEVINTIKFAHDLGVADVRIISAAQCSDVYLEFADVLHYVNKEILNAHPILNYRINNIKNKISVRGLRKTDSHRCGLLYDDCIVVKNNHYPCIIHFREGGSPIGKVGENMRQERIDWLNSHDTHEDPICKANCLDVCRDYNNKFEKLNCREI